jgi:hypothetical protein
MLGARFAVFVRRARVAHPLSCNSLFVVLEVSPAPSHCCFNLLFHRDGTGVGLNGELNGIHVNLDTHGSGALPKPLIIYI